MGLSCQQDRFPYLDEKVRYLNGLGRPRPQNARVHGNAGGVVRQKSGGLDADKRLLIENGLSRHGRNRSGHGVGERRCPQGRGTGRDE